MMTSFGLGTPRDLQGRALQARPVRFSQATCAGLPARGDFRWNRIGGLGLGRGSSSLASAAAAEREVQDTDASASEAATKEWVGLVANAEFMVHDVQNEALAEQLRERRRYFGEKGREIDFWLVPNPVWLDKKFTDKAKAVRRPCVALVSSDTTWMTFMKLRLDRVLECKLGAVSKEEVLEGNEEIPQFGDFSKWTAPYSPYQEGWWKPFLPSADASE